MADITITITLTDEELHALANWVQVEMWRVEAGEQRRHGMLVVGERVLAAASASSGQAAAAPQNGTPPSALEYTGKYFAMKSRAEHLEVQNAILMKAVEQMASRSSQMQSSLIEAGLVSKIPPPARLLESEWPQVLGAKS